MTPLQWAKQAKEAEAASKAEKLADEARRRKQAKQDRKSEIARLRALIRGAVESFLPLGFTWCDWILRKDGRDVAKIQIAEREFDTVIQWNVFAPETTAMQWSGTSSDRIAFFRDFGWEMRRHV